MPRRLFRSFQGASVSLNTSTSKIDFGTHATYKTLASAGTVSFWCRIFLPTPAAPNAYVYSLDVSNTNNIAVGTAASFWSGLSKISNIATNAVSSTAKFVDDGGRWRHVVHTWDSAGQQLYLDGELVATSATSAAQSWASDPRLVLGAYYESGSYFYYVGGEYTDLRLYARKTSAAEASAFFYSNVEPATPVARWDFSDGVGTTVTLTSGTGNNGTISGGVWTTSLPLAPRLRMRSFAGAVSTAGGATSKIDFGNHASYNAAGGSVSFWAMLAQGGTAASQEIFCLGINASDVIEFYGDISGANPGRLKVNVIRAGGAGPIAATNVGWVDFNRWHHYVIAWSASGFEIVVDGVRAYKSAADCHMAFGSNPSLMLGNYAPSTNSAFPGVYTDLRLYSSALTTAQARALYVDDIDPATPVARWDFHDGSGSTVTLLSGSGNNGTLTSGTWSTSVPMAQRPLASGRVLLVSQNLVKQSNTFSNAEWVKAKASVSAAAIAGPFAGTFADKVVEDNTAGAHTIRNSTTLVGTTASGAMYYGLWFKTGGRQYIALGEISNTGVNETFDLVNGTKRGTAPSAIMVDAGNGWYYCAVAMSYATPNLLWMALSNSNVVYSSASYTGDGTSGVYMYGAHVQFVPKSSEFIVSGFATVLPPFPRGPYVATTTSIVTGNSRVKLP